MTAVLDGLMDEITRAHKHAREIARVRVTPFVDAGAVAPRGREVWLHPADWFEVLADPMMRLQDDGPHDVTNVMGVPVVHGFPVRAER